MPRANSHLLPRRVRRFVADRALLAPPGPVVVGVSGGADSLCLLHVLLRLSGDLGISLHVAHLNHGLRGAESDADARYVAEMARGLGLAATVEGRDVRGYQAETGCSPEEAAREVRYAFFAQVAHSIGAGSVAVGHTADDQVETLLLNLIRGTGLGGLRGMQPISDWRLAAGSGLRVVRPLLEITRRETEAYCAQEGLLPRTDSSNTSMDYLRNRVRAQLLPLLEGFNPNIREGLLRMARIASADLEHFEGEVSRLWGAAVDEHEGGVSLNNALVAALPPAVQFHLLRRVLGRLLGSIRDIEAAHIEGLARALERPAGKRLSLPGGLVFQGGYARSFIAPDGEPDVPLPELDGERRLEVPGETELPGWRVRASVAEGGTGQIECSGFQACIDFDVAGQRLTVRKRRDGDRFHPLGMAEPKKLQDFMVDAKIPRAWRGRVPLVCSPEGILWVAGWRIDHRVRVTACTARVLRLEFERC